MTRLDVDKILGGIELISSTRLGLLSELYMPSVYGQLIEAVVREACATLTDPHTEGPGKAENLHQAGKILTECHHGWSAECDEDDGETFFKALASSTAWDIRGDWSQETYRYLASQGLIENEGFMTFLAPMLAVFKRLVDEDTLVGAVRAKYPQGSPWSEPRFWLLEGDVV